MVTVELGWEIAGLALTLIATIVGWIGTYIGTVKANEKRNAEVDKDLEDLKRHSFTEEDRANLQDVTTKIGLFWGIVEQQFPAFLIRSDSPRMDALLQKTEGPNGLSFFNNLTPDEGKELFDLMCAKMAAIKASKDESVDRHWISAATFYIGALGLQFGLLKPGNTFTCAEGPINVDRLLVSR